MIEKSLHDYQEDIVSDLSVRLTHKERVVLQLATGGGKTVVFSTIIQRFIERSPANKVLVLVHREELMTQARNTMYEWYGVIPELIYEGGKRRPTGQACIAMVETANNRLKKDPSFFLDYRLVIVDEAHLGNHRKVISLLMDQGARIIGCTATPISSSKKHPMIDLYEDIVCGPSIGSLIERGALLPNRTCRPKQRVDMSDMTLSNGGIKRGASGLEFDTGEMAKRYKAGVHIVNTVRQYKDKAYGRKTVIFNCNIEHSLLVMQAFRNEGIPCRHLDGKTPKEERKEILKWFKHTHNAVLCNVAVATTGFDEPSIYCVILNRDTLSLPLYLQMCGRGGRTFKGLEDFIIVDVGANHERFGDWSDNRNWRSIFFHPDEPKERAPSAPPSTCCPACDSLIHPSSRVCKWCGAEMPREMKTVNEIIQFEWVKEANPAAINVEKIIDDNPGVSEFKDLHLIKNKLIAHARSEWGISDALSEEKAFSLFNSYMEYVKEWYRRKSKSLTQRAKDYNKTIFFDTLKQEFGYEQKMQDEVLPR